jgi:NAD(P)-dependent dehydrogenase (short-subunit alcohol dehydrogenase family)
VVNTDVTKPEQCEAMVKKTLDEFGRIDVLVNNAGVGPEVQETFREQTREGAQKVMELNFFGMFNCTKAVIEHMIAQNSGKIVNISSAAAFGGPAMLPIYGAAKAAVVSLTKSQAREFARYGIHVNSIAPGLVLPPSDEYVGEKSAHANPTVSRTDRDSERMTGGAALRRMGHPSEIGKMAVILASDAASYVTGETICVDGGSVK